MEKFLKYGMNKLKAVYYVENETQY